MKRQLSVVALVGLLGLVAFLVYTGVYIFVYLFRAFRTVDPVDGRVVEIWHGDPFSRAILISILFLIGLVVLLWVGITRGNIVSRGQQVRFRSDLWAWLVEQGELTNEAPERVAERAVSAYRARLEGVSSG
ncbi:MAG: hypothetical protein HKN74_01225 [Acidimicrobiia bacterium]|nr:hypothetical protein [Acidimicrobiia bacterium]NNF08885.1 hypothetical protein [Acidimicrobiia bacterium]NNL70750.1 hypothetical protein [Acidimicrobiia bacterium]